MVKEIPNIILFSGVLISISVANVQLTTSSIVNGSQISICNSTITYSCQIKSYTLMYFLIDDIKVATCTGLFCTQFQAMPSNADFIYNTTAGIFNLTFNNINRTDTGKVIKCSDGTSTNDKEIIQNVKDYTVLFEEVSGPTGSDIKIVTGCISNTTKLSFFWNIFQANSSDVRKYTGKTETMSLDTLSCLHDPVCGSSESVKHINTLSVMESEEGSKNFIQSIVVFLEADVSYSVKINSERMYAISDEEHKVRTNSTIIIVIILIVCGVGTGMFIAIVIYCKRKYDKKSLANPFQNEQQFRGPVGNTTEYKNEKVKDTHVKEPFSKNKTDDQNQRKRYIPLKEENNEQYDMKNAYLKTTQDTPILPDSVENSTEHNNDGLVLEAFGGSTCPIRFSYIKRADENSGQNASEDISVVANVNKKDSKGPVGKKFENENGKVQATHVNKQNSNQNNEDPSQRSEIQRNEGRSGRVAYEDNNMELNLQSPDSVKKNTKNNDENVGVKRGKEQISNADVQNPSQSERKILISRGNSVQSHTKGASLKTKQDTPESSGPVVNSTQHNHDGSILHARGNKHPLLNDFVCPTSPRMSHLYNSLYIKLFNGVQEENSGQLATRTYPMRVKLNPQHSKGPVEKNTEDKYVKEQISNKKTYDLSQRREIQQNEGKRGRVAFIRISMKKKLKSLENATKNEDKKVGGKRRIDADIQSPSQSKRDIPLNEDDNKQCYTKDNCLKTRQDIHDTPDAVEYRTEHDYERFLEECGNKNISKNLSKKDSESQKSKKDIKRNSGQDTRDISLGMKLDTPGAQDSVDKDAVDYTKTMADVHRIK